MSVDGKTVLITGANSGIGLASALTLAKAGARVAATGRRTEAVAETQTTLGDSHLSILADAGDRDAMRGAIRQTVERFGKIDFLFLNAGCATVAPATATSEDAFDQMLRTNLRGPFFTVADATPHLNNGASILFNVTTAVSRAWSMTSAYLATKAGLLALTRVLAAELGERQIRVNAISPGVVETAMHGKLGLTADQTQSFMNTLMPRLLLGRTAQPSDIAAVVEFMASDASRYITAEEILVDGGIGRS